MPAPIISMLAARRVGRAGSACRRAVLATLGVLAFCAGPTGATAQTPPVARPSAADPYAAHIAEAAQRYGIPERWIRAVLRAESAGDVRAISSAGALGLMQVMPDTWAALRARYRLGRDPYDPHDNIMAGAAYLREMHDRYGNVTAMLASYNAGPGRYDEHLSRGRPLPAETLAYLEKLAPITGGSDDTQLAVAPPPDPFAWRRAALFAVRPGAVSPAPLSADRTASEVQPERPADDRTGLVMADAAPPSNDLFVPLAGRPSP